MELSDKDPILDHLVDSGLKRYSQVLPPAGLEMRVLANLRAEQEKRVVHPWPSWAAAVAVALCALAAGTLFMVRKPGNSPEPGIHRSLVDTAGPGLHSPATANSVLAPTLSTGSKWAPSFRARTRVATISPEPRLGEFPSPAPLSEQEEMLVRYIRERPHEAALMARAQAELLKGDRQLFAPLLSAGPQADSE
jgi:hypothetical protein